MSKIKETMAYLDAMYKVFVEHNSNPAETVAYYNTKYGFSTASVKDMLTTAIIKANKDAKGESCIADVEALIARHAKKRLTMSKQPLYAKLIGDKFAEGEISFNLSRKVTCITGEIDLMEILRQIAIAAHCTAPVDFRNRLDNITRLEWIISGNKGKQDYGISVVTALFQFASIVMGRQVNIVPTKVRFGNWAKIGNSIEMVAKLGQDVQYLINWASSILYSASSNVLECSTLESCDKLFAIPYPEAFLSPLQQSRLMPALLKLLPNARFVIATQSPIILANIQPKEQDYNGYLMRLIDEDNEGNPNRIHAMQL